MADQKADQKPVSKSIYPQRCGERIKMAQVASSASLAVQVVGSSKTLRVGIKSPDYTDSIIEGMALHPAGLFVQASIKGTKRRVIVPYSALAYYELVDEE